MDDIEVRIERQRLDDDTDAGAFIAVGLFVNGTSLQSFAERVERPFAEAEGKPDLALPGADSAPAIETGTSAPLGRSRSNDIRSGGRTPTEIVGQAEPVDERGRRRPYDTHPKR